MTIRACLVTLLSAALLLPGQSGNADFTFRVEGHLVVLSVHVQDKQGRSVDDLASQDFQVIDEGQIQPIRQFSHEDRPVTVGILVDSSASMRNKQADVILAALSFISSSNPQDEVFVVNFNSRPWLGLPEGVPFTNDQSQLQAALESGSPQGRTALFDALILAAQHISTGKWEKKVLLLISDGGDNQSSAQLTDAIHAVEASGATVYTIGIFDAGDHDSDPKTLQLLAKMSGGEAVLPKKTEEVTAICNRIATRIRDSYTLAFEPPPGSRTGVTHKLKVTVNNQHRGKLNVRTRESYLLPPER